MDFQQKFVQLSSVFSVLKAGRPMLLYEELQDLFKHIKMPGMLRHRSDTAGWEMATALDQVLQARVEELVSSASFLAFSLDESMDAGHHSRMVLHIYFVRDWQRVCIFVAIPRVKGAPSAAALTDLAVSTLLGRLGMSAQELRDRLVMVAADGAAVLQGVHSGLIKRVQDWWGPWAHPMHCICHRVNLCGGVLDGHALMAVICNLGSACYSYFCRSPLRASRLEAAQAELGLPVHQMMRDVETRWVSHFPPAQRVSEQMPALILHAVREVAEQSGAAQAAALEHQARLTDLERMLGLAAVLPMLRGLNTLIKVCSCPFALLTRLLL